jgi:hypothetical protein
MSASSALSFGGFRRLPCGFPVASLWRGGRDLTGPKLMQRRRSVVFSPDSFRVTTTFVPENRGLSSQLVLGMPGSYPAV